MIRIPRGGCASAGLRCRDSGRRLMPLLPLVLTILAACTPPDGEPFADADGDGIANAEDCDPADPDVYEGAAEVCDGLDNDCNGLVDEGFDHDNDGVLGDVAACTDLEGPFDCDDEDPFAHPGAAEVCDGSDNDCDGAVDEDWDADGDGSAGCWDDCDDDDPDVAPAFPEVCDGQDNDCDAQVDEGFDMDADGWATCRGDCDDAHATVNPGAEELCDGLDNDCDATTSEDGDLDGDGITWCDGDCDDNEARAYPGAAEVCDGIDNDCSGFADEPMECWSCTSGADGRSYCTNSVTWENARAACTMWGGDLASAADYHENYEIADIAYAVWNNYWWIGFNDIEEEGTWVWSDGNPATFTSWYHGEPNDSGGEDCAGTDYGAIGTWNDFNCASALPFVCEFP